MGALMCMYACACVCVCACVRVRVYVCVCVHASPATTGDVCAGDCPYPPSCAGDCPYPPSCAGDCPYAPSCAGDCPHPPSCAGDCPHPPSRGGGYVPLLQVLQFQRLTMSDVCSLSRDIYVRHKTIHDTVKVSPVCVCSHDR